MKTKVLTLLVLLSFSSVAYPCSRCGLFGARCRFFKAPVKYVAPVTAVVPQQNLLIVQNSYPQPIGAYAAQGNSVYGYNAAAAAYFVAPSEVLRQAAELSRAASATASIGLSGYSQLANTQLALQASISEPLARGHAASQVLTAAGFTAPAQQTQSLALKITQDASGQWQVLSANPVEVNAQVSAALSDSVPQAPASNSIIATKCSRCHGLNLAEPKGGMFLDAGHRLSCEAAMKALQLVKNGKMPKDGPPLTPQEKGLLLDELLTLSQSP